MYKKYLTLLLVTSFSLAENVGFEYSGVKLKTITADKKEKFFMVKRNIPEVCKKIPITNEMLWTGNFAHEKVPDICKSTYVHTKGKLLPMQLDDDLDTYGELEVLAFLKEMQYKDQMLLIDSRKASWFEYRTIPGAINIPFIYFKYRDNYEFHFEYVLKTFGCFSPEKWRV
jgi:hypothetical protein